MAGEGGEALPEGWLIEPGSELDQPWQRGVISAAQHLEEQLHHHGARAPQHAGVIGAHRRRESGQALEGDGGEGGAVDPLERRDGSDVDRRVRVPQQLQHARRVLGRRCDGEEAGRLEALPPAGRVAVRPHQPRPPVIAQRRGELAPAVAGHARRPRHEGVDRQWHGEARQPEQHGGHVRGAERPALHRVVELDDAGVQLRAAPQPEPAVEDDQHDEGREEDALHERHDGQELATGHLPTQRRIFSSATRRLIGFTR